MRHFLSLLDLSPRELVSLLDRAETLRTLWRERAMPPSLAEKRVALWFYGEGFRNRIAFELGAQAMGATVTYVPGELGSPEPIEDVAGYLQNWFDLLVIRARRHEDLAEVARRSRVPVLSARTDRGHPCEILGDLLYLRRLRGSLSDLHIVFVGETSNLCRSWLEAAHALPIRVTQVCPPGWEVEASELATLRKEAAGEIEVTYDLNVALCESPVDVIYTDCWPATDTPEQKRVLARKFLPYQIQQCHLDVLGESGAFLPCPPVTRGQEVSHSVMLSPLCRNHGAKDDLLHAQNALLEWHLR